MNLEEIRDFCLTFPGVTEEIKWGNDLCFLIGGKMFAVAGLDTGQLSFKCTPERFAELTEKDGILPAPYVARYHWVLVEKLDAIDEDELEDLVSKSYMMVWQNLPENVRKTLSKQ